MRKRIVLLLFACSLAGCVSGGRMWERSYWKSAMLTREQFSERKEQFLAVQPGDATVLKLKDGRSGQRMTTAHPSHDSLYFVLPRELEKGKTYSVSPKDGTFGLAAFSGYSYWYVDEASPFQASVHIVSLGLSSVQAKVVADFTAIYDRNRVAEGQQPKRKIHYDGVYVFRLKRFRKSKGVNGITTE